MWRSDGGLVTIMYLCKVERKEGADTVGMGLLFILWSKECDACILDEGLVARLSLVAQFGEQRQRGKAWWIELMCAR
jgi:hypothetical protein